MSAIEQTRWKCDRCSKDVYTSRTEQPEGWVRVRVSDPPKSDPVNMSTTRFLGDLCDDCVPQLDALLAGANVEEQTEDEKQPPEAEPKKKGK